MRRTFEKDYGFLNFAGWADNRLQPIDAPRAFEPVRIGDFAALAQGNSGAMTIGADQSLAAPQMSPSPIGILGVTPDEAGDSIGGAPGNPLVTVDAPASTIGTIGTIGDQDYYTVNLVAGQTYEIGMFGYYPGGPSLFPLSDSYIELYSSAGQILGSADGGASTLSNQANSGFDAVLNFTATVTGTYYINARAFDQDPTNGTTGDGVGDYELYVKTVDPNDPNIYHPYYNDSSPLYAIDWGTRVNKVNQSAANPDGNEGTHPTGNAQGTPIYNVNHVSGLDVPALAQQQGVNISGKNVITVYFAKAGDIFTSNDPTNPGLPPATITATGVQAFERNAVITSLGEFAKVADIVYLEVQDRNQADFIYTSYQGTPGPGVSLLGSMSPPDESDEGLAQFNSGDERWNALNLQQGGFSFVTLIHEFGHGHGLAHPHDNGGHSGIMHGVESEGPVADYTLGDYELNQSVFTMMSYEDGWQSSPYGNAPTNVGYGYLGGLMAFDIAAIQDKYGVNEEWATGNDTYVMKDVNAAGTYYSSIWDGGGVDSIVYSGARDANIDLRPATLQYEVGGAGYVSYATGIFGGYTIANGVTIENATGGSGNDTITGNAAANVLNGGAGTDTLSGGGGDDTYYVDNVGDVVRENAGGGQDIVYSSASYTLTAGAEVEILSTRSIAATNGLSLTGNELGQQLWGDFGNNLLNGAGGADVMLGFLGDDSFYIDNDNDVIRENVGEGSDIAYSSITYRLNAGASVEILSTRGIAGTDAINLTGNELAQQVWGNFGANILNGAGGADTMIGFAGDDIYCVDNAGDAVREDAGGGDDVVYATVSYTLTAGSSVEVLSAATISNTGALNLTGNALSQGVWGNNGANVLDGGAGADSLIGYGGADTFAFTSALGGGNVDRIVDFEAGSDKIALDDAIFTGLGLGALAAGAFRVGTSAQDSDDRIIYDQTSGALYFDADGAGGAAAVQFATVAGGPVLNATDFTVI